METGETVNLSCESIKIVRFNSAGFIDDSSKDKEKAFVKFLANQKVMEDRIIISSVLSNEIDEIGNCKVIVTDSKWTISGWYVNKAYQNKGFGNQLLKETFQYVIDNGYIPDSIDYIWNGTNQYVYEWIVDKFDAYCDCPIAVRKNAFDDDWNSHIYHLDKDKLFEYFLLKGKEGEKDFEK